MEMPHNSPLPADTRADTRRLFWVIGIFFGAFLAWGGLAELDAGAIATGEVIPAGRVRTVQHMDGGLIRSINVKEGQRVEAGEALLTLDAKEAEAAAAIARKELNGYAARLADARREEAGWRARAITLKQMEANTAEESKINQELYEKNFIARPRLLQLANQQAQATASVQENAAELARAQQKLGELEVAEATARDRLAVAEERVVRTRIVAPQAGLVQGLKFTTLGGVIPPGGVVLDLVPESDELVVEAMVAPDDIDVVAPGYDARVRLTAFKSRTHISLYGKVTQVSGSTFHDERASGMTTSYYKARVLIAADELKKIDGYMLTPGMLAQVEIVAGRRTALRYMFDPIIDSMRRAFRES